MFCFIEDLPVVAFERGVPWNWESFAEYRAAFDAQGAAVNQASFVGHSALRLFVMGDEAFLRRAHPAEREQLVELFEDCLEAVVLEGHCLEGHVVEENLAAYINEAPERAIGAK